MFSALKNAFNSVKSVFKKEENKKEQKTIPIIKTNKELKISNITKIKSTFSKKYFLSESDLKDLIDDIEIQLLQADLSMEVVDNILEKLKEKITKEGLEKDKIKESILDLFLKVVEELLPKSFEEDFFNNRDKPYIIMFIGTNGTGKTTSIAKLAYYLKNKGKKIVLAASDTYRAASIEQLEGHAKNIGVEIIKGKYGQDPASVAYDAVAFAKKNKFDFVLIDTAGRQDTNLGLMKELEKIKRVVNPNLVVFVAEALAGQTAIMQATNFNDKIGFDAFVLTKTDVDEKGGTLLSIAIGLKKPVFFLGMGQEYKDIAFFNINFLKNALK